MTSNNFYNDSMGREVVLEGLYDYEEQIDRIEEQQLQIEKCLRERDGLDDLQLIKKGGVK